jgi:hypothetical protein
MITEALWRTRRVCPPLSAAIDNRCQRIVQPREIAGKQARHRSWCSGIRADADPERLREPGVREETIGGCVGEPRRLRGPLETLYRRDRQHLLRGRRALQHQDGVLPDQLGELDQQFRGHRTELELVGIVRIDNGNGRLA